MAVSESDGGAEVEEGALSEEDEPVFNKFHLSRLQN